MRRDLLLMLRLVLWLAFVVVMTPLAAVIFRAMSRILRGVDLE